MIVAGLLLLAGIVVGFVLWQSRPAAGQPWRFAMALLMTAGALLALISGLSAMAGAILVIEWGRQQPGFGRSPEDLVLAAMPFVLLPLTAIGVWMYRRGRAQVRR